MVSKGREDTQSSSPVSRSREDTQGNSLVSRGREGTLSVQAEQPMDQLGNQWTTLLDDWQQKMN